jgi:hypothetical protein
MQTNKVRNSQSAVRNIYMSGFDSSTMWDAIFA